MSIFLAEGVGGSNQHCQKVSLVPKDIPNRWYDHPTHIHEKIRKIEKRRNPCRPIWLVSWLRDIYIYTGAQARAPLGGRPVDVENDIVNFYYSKFEKMILSNLQIVEVLCFDLYSQFDGLEMFQRDLEIFKRYEMWD